jgi:hypothetical protein
MTRRAGKGNGAPALVVDAISAIVGDLRNSPR